MANTSFASTSQLELDVFFKTMEVNLTGAVLFCPRSQVTAVMAEQKTTGPHQSSRYTQSGPGLLHPPRQATSMAPACSSTQVPHVLFMFD